MWANAVEGFTEIERELSELKELVSECRENTDRGELNFRMVDLRFKIASFRVYLVRSMANSQSDRVERRIMFYEKNLSGIGFDLKVIEDNIKAADYAISTGEKR